MHRLTEYITESVHDMTFFEVVVITVVIIYSCYIAYKEFKKK